MPDAGVKLLQPFFLLLRPKTSHGGRGNGDAALAFLLHPVGHGVAVIDVADLVDQAGVKEYALGRGGFAGINVRGNADIARPFHRELALGRIHRLLF